MRRLLFAVALPIVTLPLLAADETKANTLTPKEIADGWILLFDGETTFGWKSDGEVKAADGALVIGGKEPSLASFTSAFKEFELRFEYRLKNAMALEMRQTLEKMPKEDYFQFGLPEPDGERWAELAFTVQQKKTTIHQRGVKGGDKKQEIRWLANDNSVHVSFSTGKDNQGFVRNVRLRPLGLKSIFNGKDLSGWKEHPGKKSQWSVGAEGTIDVKNGPGDLQTEGQWADFVLQIECKSNGKHLNSGVFFRCIAGQYQNGYEAQIHNGFLPEATKEYTIEEYDPQTHKLAGSKKAKYAAIDYGTGGIYRRMPARKQMSKDNEWFTMTVAAQGRHLATWVNGVQVVDWIDNRPENDNARNGCKLAKGSVSLQGHDPTTDLSFRNIRIAELAAGEKK
jgi:hypothetical protein